MLWIHGWKMILATIGSSSGFIRRGSEPRPSPMRQWEKRTGETSRPFDVTGGLGVNATPLRGYLSEQARLEARRGPARPAVWVSWFSFLREDL